MRKKILGLPFLLILLLSCTPGDLDDNVVHKAFTDLIYFNNQFFLTYRESNAHVYGRDGIVKVYNSQDATDWKLLKEFKVNGVDLRDPKFSVNGEELSLYIHGSKYQGQKLIELSDYTSKFSISNGWQTLQNVALDNLKTNTSKITGNEAWPWRITWYNNIAYAFGYSADNQIDLYTSADGLYFKGTNTSFVPNNYFSYANEATIRANSKGVFYAVIRGKQDIFLVKSSNNQSKSWEVFDKIPAFAFGGPNFLFYNNKMLITGRDSNIMKVVLYSYDLDTNTYKQSYVFPSGGDCGYAGMVIKGDELWVSYFSSHERSRGGASVYVVKINLKDLSL